MMHILCIIMIKRYIAGYIHDAVLQWAHGVNRTLEQGFPPDDGIRVTQNIFNLTFDGVTGKVVIDGSGNRLSDYR